MSGVSVAARHAASRGVTYSGDLVGDVVGWLERTSMQNNEPSLLGRTVAEGIWGRVGVSSGAAATIGA